MNDKFSLQDDKYVEPYHHYVGFNEFSISKSLFWGIEYYAYMSVAINIIRKAYEESGGAVVDIGCGDGKLLHELRNFLPSADLHGFDLSARAIQFAKAYSPDVDFINGDYLNYLDKLGEISAVSLIEVLEHISDDSIDGFLSDIHKLAGDKTKIVVSVPSKNVPLIKKHYRHYDLPLLKNQMRKFHLLDVRYVYYNKSIFLHILERCVINRYFILLYSKIRHKIFRYIEKEYFIASANNCKHILAVFKK